MQEKDRIMLELDDVKKDYVAGDTVVHALKGVTLQFANKGLVCVLGQSGCGKTTLMNVIGGLDRLTSGGITIDGISTANYSERDWNTYRNHFIGFVFQSYNLVPHMSVLANVELALTLSGVSRAERKQRSVEMLKRVGLESELGKRPNQLSGGQCQRVAIARALAGDPEVILADEPTGAIDSETSIIIMDILKEISMSKLVIMVTHNAELATKYADRIITMRDGLVTSDTAAGGREIIADAEEPTEVLAQELEPKQAPIEQSIEDAASAGANVADSKEQTGAHVQELESQQEADLQSVEDATESGSGIDEEEQTGAHAQEPESQQEADLQSIEDAASAGEIVADAEKQNDALIPEKQAGTVVAENGEEIAETQVYQDETTTQTADIKNKECKTRRRKKRASMSFGSAIKQSFNNLIHKKGRTALTIIAGSIGIICIFLILALNTGFSDYIVKYETESLSKYPIETRSSSNDLLEMIKGAVDSGKIHADNVDLSKAFEAFAEENNLREKYTEEQLVYVKKVILSVVDDMESAQYKFKIDNDISEFSKYVDEHNDASWGTIRKDYGLNLQIYHKGEDGYAKINPLSDIVMEGVGEAVGGLDDETKTEIKTLVDTLSGWSMMVDDVNVLSNQYDVLAGEWPDYTTEYGRNGLVVVVDEYNQISDYTLLFLDKMSVVDMLIAFLTGSTEEVKMEYDFNEFLTEEYSLMLNTDYYTYNTETSLYDYSVTQELVETKSIPLHVSAIVRLKEGQAAGCIGGTIGYTQALAEYVINGTNNSALVQAQNVEYQKYLAVMAEGQRIAKKMEEEELAAEDLPPEEQLALAQMATAGIKSVITGENMSPSEYNQWEKDMQILDLNKPKAIYFYPSSIDNKNSVVGMIDDFNAYVKATPELSNSTVDYTVTYTDELSEISASMKQMINTITYVLIAVAVLAVVVAMLLVAIILYISVQDRTKEIGVLRALGAGKGNIAGLFLAETFLIGVASGIFGVLLGFILKFPANAIIYKTLEIKDLLEPSWWQSLLLVCFSFLTTIISGLIPSAIAAKKDPVVALRTE